MPLEPAPLRRRSRAVVWAAAPIGVVLLAVAFIAVFDWTWCRPLIQHYIQQRSGRQVDFDRLQIGLDRHLAPTVHLRNLRIQNAAWATAASTPLIIAEEFSATFDPASLLHGERIVITRMTLAGADIELEMQADGLRNWRLTNPDDRGPGRVRVLLLDAQRSRLRSTNARLQLALQLQSEPLATTSSVPGLADMPLTRTLAVKGSRRAIPFEGRFEVSDVLSLYDSDRSFALRGEIGTGGARLSMQGQARDLMQLGGFDAVLRARGVPSAEIAALLGGSLPPLPALHAEIDAHVRKDGAVWNATDLVARIGHSDLSGDLNYRAGSRGTYVAGSPAASQVHDSDVSHVSTDTSPQLRATLTSRRIDVAEWRGTHDRPSTRTKPTSAPASAASTAPAQGPAAAPLDAQVDWRVERLDGLPLPVSALRTHAVWRDEHLTLAPFAAIVADGATSGRLDLATAGSSVDLRIDGLQLARLGMRDLAGQLNAHVALRSKGASVDSLLGALTGSAEAELHRGTLPATLEAKLGLDGGRWLRALIKGDHARSAIRCSSLRLHIEQGVGALQHLALETETLLLNGSGSIDLPHRRLDIALTPHRKQNALLALDDSIHIDGAFSAPKISLARRSDAAAQPLDCTGSPQRLPA